MWIIVLPLLSCLVKRLGEPCSMLVSRPRVPSARRIMSRKTGPEASANNLLRNVTQVPILVLSLPVLRVLCTLTKARCNRLILPSSTDRVISLMTNGLRAQCSRSMLLRSVLVIVSLRSRSLSRAVLSIIMFPFGTECISLRALRMTIVLCRSGWSTFNRLVSLCRFGSTLLECYRFWVSVV